MRALVRQPRRVERGVDRGFTLVEAVWVMAIAGLVMAISVWGVHNYLAATQESNTSSQIQSALRNAAERSLAEGRTYCVGFTSSTWTTYYVPLNGTSCTTQLGGVNKVADASDMLTTSFPVPSGMDSTETTTCVSGKTCTFFYPRGNALAGTVEVSRSGGSNVYLTTVVGLTGRVFSCHLAATTSPLACPDGSG